MTLEEIHQARMKNTNTSSLNIAQTNHVCQSSHIMDWKASEIVEQESDKFKRWIKESIHIRPNTPNMNRDE